MSVASGALLAAFVVLVAALFVLAVVEASLLHVRRSAIASAGAEGDRRSRRLLELLDDLPSVMNAVLLAVLAAQVTAAGIAGALARQWFGDTGITIATVAVTMILFIYGEAIPKTIAIRDPARYGRRLVGLVRALNAIMHPVVLILVKIADWQSPGPGGVDTVTTVSERELLHLTVEAAAAGQIEESDAELIERSFSVGDLRVQQILIPIDQVVAVAADTGVDEALRTAIRAGHRRVAVHDGDRTANRRLRAPARPGRGLRRGRRPDRRRAPATRPGGAAHHAHHRPAAPHAGGSTTPGRRDR